MELKPGYPAYGTWSVPIEKVGSYIKKILFWVFLPSLAIFLVGAMIGKPSFQWPTQLWIVFIVFWEDMKMYHEYLDTNGWIIKDKDDDA